jgi:hypothetical protein
MNKPLLLFLCLLFFLTTSHAQLKIDYQHFAGLFNAGKYKQAYNEALALRVKPYGKKPVLDYFIAKALCASGQYPAARKGYTYILSEYDLKKDQRQFIVEELTSCAQAAVAPVGAPNKLGYLATAGATNSNVALVMGKIGYVLDCSGNDQAYVFNPNASITAYDERLFNLNALDSAVSYYRVFFKNKYKVAGKERFVYITQHDAQIDIDRITQRLHDAYTFYTGFFGIRAPDKVITVYLMDDKRSLMQVARETHGLALPTSNIGYSYLNDLSVLGISANNSIGTIYHELFHIMIRTDLGDIPGWLDEGIACLYATSSWEGNILRGDKVQWRTEVLQDYVADGKPVPTLQEIIQNNWSEFSKNESNSICEVALNYAVSHHFAIYLQEKNLLGKTVAAFKNRQNVFTDTTAVNEPADLILEGVVGMPLNDIQRSFDGWLMKEYRIFVTHKPIAARASSADVAPLDHSAGGASETTTYSFTKQGIERMYHDLEALKIKKAPCVEPRIYKRAEKDFINLISDAAWGASTGDAGMVLQTDAGSSIPEHLQAKAHSFIENAGQVLSACSGQR